MKPDARPEREEEPSLLLSTSRVPRLRRAFRPIRRFLAWFSLVYEEADWRKHGDAQAVARLELLESEGSLSMRVAELEARVVERIDLLLSDLWRRFESSSATHAVQIQKLDEIAHRISRENAAILTFIEGASDLSIGASSSSLQLKEGEVIHMASSSLGRGEASPSGERMNGAKGIPTSSMLERELERGSREDVMDKLRPHLNYLAEASPILDLGCGRGEFLELAQWLGLNAYGIDLDNEVLSACRGLGLDVRCEDMFQHLATVDAESIGGIMCAHVVEHLSADMLQPLLASIARVLKPGGVAIIETPNPASFATHVHSFWRDPTHIRPVPSPTLAAAARAAGLLVKETIFKSPPASEEALPVPDVAAYDPPLRPIVQTLRETTVQLNYLLYGPQDYAIVAIKPE